MNTQAENQGLDPEELANGFDTEGFAAQCKVKSNTIRRQHCLTGHYMGIKPIKLPNRKLVWPRADVERVLNGDAK